MELRAAAAREAVQDVKGEFGSAAIQLVATCVERCAQDHAKATREKAWCHQQLSAAQSAIGDAGRIVDWQLWDKYFVPGSHHITSLKKLAREENFILALTSENRLRQTPDTARGEPVRFGRLLFGRWPL